MQDHRVIEAMRHGNGTELVAQWLAEREAEQLPPFGEMLALELGPSPADADAALRELAGTDIAVFGPGAIGDRSRWLLQAPDLRQVKIRLRSQVQSWRDKGVTVRVDADPLDV
jgi:primosomal protein N'